MKVNKIFIVAAVVAQLMLGMATPVYANVQKDVAVSAMLNAVIILEDAGTGLPLDTPPQVVLQWDGLRFDTWRYQVLIATNNHSKDVLVSLVSAAELMHGTSTIPLKVELNSIPITTTGVVLSAASLFGNVGIGPAVSFGLWLTISADPPAIAPDAGTWTGTVNIALAQST